MKKLLLTGALLASSLLSSTIMADDQAKPQGPTLILARSININQGHDGMIKAMGIAKSLQKSAREAGINMMVQTPLSGNPYQIFFVIQAKSLEELSTANQKLLQHPAWEKAVKEATSSNLFGATYDFWSAIE